MVVLPKYKAPFDVDFKEYNSALKVFNTTFQNRIATALRDGLSVNRDFVILTTGSDGRLEKGPASDIELIVLYSNYAKKNNYIPYILSKINETENDKEELIELKCLDSDNMSRYENNADRTFPSRLSDSVYLFGQRRFHYEAKEKMLEEFRGEEGKSILNRVKSRKKEFEKSLLTGVQKFNKDTTIQHYDLNEGVSFYNSEKNQFSFKTGPLRLIQYGLMQNIIKFSRASDYESARLLLRNSPTNTSDKIFAFEAEGISNLSHQETSDLANNYSYFLWAYTASQEWHTFKGDDRLTFDKQEVKERLKSVDKIMKKDILKIK